LVQNGSLLHHIRQQVSKRKTKNESYKVYCGLDKFENETLIKYSWPVDVWFVFIFLKKRFHADKHSSAHYYLRLKDGETIDDIPEEVLSDICQMTKESSKDGRKLDDIRIIYTLASNLKSKTLLCVNISKKLVTWTLVKLDFTTERTLNIIWSEQRTVKL
jgi:hypothetical protein